MHLRLRSFLFICCFLVASIILPAAHAQGTRGVRQAPVPSWVKPIVANWDAQTPENEVSEGVHTLLYDRQMNHPQATKFVHLSQKILNASGLETFSEVQMDFDPAYQSLDIHYLRIYRNGKLLDRLQLNALTVIQMERRSDRHLYDGELSALIFIEDLRIGDVIDYAYSVHGRNPILEGHTVDLVYLTSVYPMDQVFQREIVPDGFASPFRFENSPQKAVETMVDGNKAFDWHAFQVSSTPYEVNVPESYNPMKLVEISDFGSWEEVRAHIEAFFDKVDWGGPAIQEIADSITRHQRDSSAMALEAIRFVQDEIRYLGMEGGINGYRPHPSLQTLRQRFGDCKDKSLLLVGLLRAMHLPAWPALVNTTERYHLKEHLPSPLNFDHCIVKLRLAGQTHWIDPTISNQGGDLSGCTSGNLGWALVIGESGDALQKIPKRDDCGSIQIIEEWEMGKVGGAITVELQTIYKGIEADMMRRQLQSESVEYLEKRFLRYFAETYGRTEPKRTPIFHDNRALNQLVISESYYLLNPWEMRGSTKGEFGFDLQPSLVRDYVPEVRELGRRQPYALEFPLNVDSRIHLSFLERIDFPTKTESIVAKEFEYSSTFEADPDRKGISLHYALKHKVGVVPTKDFKAFAANFSKVNDNVRLRISESVYNPTSKLLKWLPKDPETRWKVIAVILTVIFGAAMITIARWKHIMHWFGYGPRP